MSKPTSIFIIIAYKHNNDKFSLLLQFHFNKILPSTKALSS